MASQGNHKLSKVVKEFLNEQGEFTEHRYARYLQIAISGLRELNMDVDGAPVAVSIKINKSNDTAALPANFVDYTMIGICDSATGKVNSLGWNSKMCKPISYDDCGNIFRPEVNRSKGVTERGEPIVSSVWSGYEGGFFRNGEIVGRLFGVGGGNNSNGLYRIDTSTGLIVLQDVAADYIYLEYLADIETVDGEYVVDGRSLEALKAYIRFKDIINPRVKHFSNNDRVYFERLWEKEKTKANNRFKTFTIDEAVAVIRKANKQAPKF